MVYKLFLKLLMAFMGEECVFVKRGLLSLLYFTKMLAFSSKRWNFWLELINVAYKTHSGVFRAVID